MKFLIVAVLAIASSAIGYNIDDIRCIPFSSFELDCNTCTCTKDGTIGSCSYVACQQNEGIIKYIHIPKAKRETKQVCQPRTTFKNYCNSCTCSSDGTDYACTRMACDKDIWNPDGSLKISPKSNRVARSVSKQVCQPRTTFKNYCNSCTCSPDGTEYACTRMACDKDIWNPDGSLKISPKSNRVTRSVPKQVCQPRTTFKKYCNSCTCSADGTEYACTRMACDEDIWNADGSLKINIKDVLRPHSRIGRSISSQVCEPLTQYMDYCNTCFCGIDGTPAGCTKMMCNENVWNKDGSLKVNAPNSLN